MTRRRCARSSPKKDRRAAFTIAARRCASPILRAAPVSATACARACRTLGAARHQPAHPRACIDRVGRRRAPHRHPAADADPAHLAAIISIAGIDAVVVDEGTTAHAAFDRLTRVVCRPMIESLAGDLPPRIHTEWVMMTSGTTGVPKMVIHDLATLTTALRVPSPADGADVWGTFYDIRRYGGLQIYLRAVCGGASLVLSSAGEPVPDHLARLGGHGVTHLSGTPSQWRRALMMMPANQAIAPRYVRLSGEIADRGGCSMQLARGVSRAQPPGMLMPRPGSRRRGSTSTTAWPAFRPNISAPVRNGVDTMKILDGTLRIRSSGAAKGYVGGEWPLLDAAGFRRFRRHHRAARASVFISPAARAASINIGGLKKYTRKRSRR